MIHLLSYRGWLAITALGDASVTLPCVVLMAIWLSISAATASVAWRWLVLFASVAGLVAVSKLAYMAWGLGIPSLDFIGLSGHAAMAAVVWPALLALVGAHAGSKWRVAGAVAGLLLALAVGTSRLALEVHSVTEVVSGFLAGAIIVSVFLSRMGSRWCVKGCTGYLVLCLVAIMPLVYGHRFPSERLLSLVAEHLNVGHLIHTRRTLHVDQG